MTSPPSNVAALLHNSRHATGGLDAVSPAMIGGLAAAQNLSDVNNLGTARRNLHAAPDALPSYAPATLTGRFRPERSTYGLTGANWHQVRAAKFKLIGGEAGMHVGFIGDSSLAGFDGTTYTYAKSIPAKFGTSLASRLGVTAKTGFTLACAASATVGDRWAVTGGFIGFSSNALVGYGTGTATATTADAGTSVEFMVSDSSASFTYTIDGGSPITVTTTATTNARKVSATGLSNATHTIVVSGVTAAYVIILTTPRAFTPGDKNLVVHNLALGGSGANSGTATINWSDTTGTGLGTLAQRITGQWGITLDALVICCGHNDVFQGTATASILAGMTAMRGYFSATAAMWMIGPKVSGTLDAPFFDFIGGMYGLSDSLAMPMFDWNDHTNGRASFSSDGLVGGDGFHPTFSMQAGTGLTLANIIGESA